MKRTLFNVDYNFFSGEKVEHIAIVSFKEKPIMYTADLHEKKYFFDYLDFISTHEKIRVILFFGPSRKMRCDEYLGFYKKLSKLGSPTWGMDVDLIERFYNAINQFVLKMVECEKMVITADSGDAILIYLSVSLGCDYRIIADNTVYSNPNLELGVIPNGGVIYFLSKMVGRKKTLDILLSGRDLAADEALRLGIVDKVVPVGELKETALKVAQTYAKKSSSYLSGIKRLSNYDTGILRNVLENENEILRMGI